MNADRRKALVAAAVIRAKLLEISVAEALETTLEKASVRVSETEWTRLLRDSQAVLDGRCPDKPEQLEIAV